MKDLRSPEVIAQWERDSRKCEAERKAAEKRHDAIVKRAWSKGAPWLPIKDCPFEAFEYQPILVTDGKQVAIAYVYKRFGTPRECLKEPEIAITDHGMAYVGGEYRKPKRPAWWFKWELDDGTEDSGEFGRPELRFVPTRWLPLPPAKPIGQQPG